MSQVQILSPRPLIYLLFFLPKSFWVPARERVGSYSGSQFLLMLGAECVRVEPTPWFPQALPLGQAKLMTFELIPLGPLSPLALLLPPAS